MKSEQHPSQCVRPPVFPCVRVPSRRFGGIGLIGAGKRCMWARGFVPLWMVAGALAVVGSLLAGGAWGQDRGSALRVDRDVSLALLPDAPGVVPLVERGQGGQAVLAAPVVPAQSQGTGRVDGVVLDVTGAGVGAAQVALVNTTGDAEQDMRADAHGAFSFDGLGPGMYKVTVTADGLETFVSAGFTLGAGETKLVDGISMRVATNNSIVNVTASPDEVAHAQVKEAEKQRVLGIIPNFYSSYIWHAAPLTPKLKFDLAFRSTTDPVTVLIVAGIAGVQQAHNTFPGYGSGPAAYGKRFGAAYADNVIGRFLGGAILPSVLHQDPRYFYKGTGSVWSRGLYALSTAVIARGDNGRWQPNYSHVLGNFAAAGISNLYRDPADRSASLTLRNGFIITGTNALGNLVRELVLKKMTSSVPAFATGKPGRDRGVGSAP